MNWLWRGLRSPFVYLAILAPGQPRISSPSPLHNCTNLHKHLSIAQSHSRPNSSRQALHRGRTATSHARDTKTLRRSCPEAMSKTKVRSHLLQLVDSDFEDGIGGNEFDVARPSTKSQSAMPPKKAKAGRQPANRVTKPAPKTSTSRRGASDRVAAAVEEATAGQGTNKGSNATTAPPAKGPGRGRGRKPAATADAEDEDTIMTEATETVTETPPAAKAKGTRGRPKKVVVEAEPEPPAARRGRKPAAKKATTEDVSEIPETQQPDTTQSDIEEDQDDLAILPTLKSPERARTGRGSVPIPSSISKRPLPASSSDKGDPALRRRLGEMTQKYEALEQKHRDLKEVAVREAERNFDKLKKASEEKSKGKSPPSQHPLTTLPTN